MNTFWTKLKGWVAQSSTQIGLAVLGTVGALVYTGHLSEGLAACFLPFLLTLISNKTGVNVTVTQAEGILTALANHEGIGPAVITVLKQVAPALLPVIGAGAASGSTTADVQAVQAQATAVLATLPQNATVTKIEAATQDLTAVADVIASVVEKPAAASTIPVSGITGMLMALLLGATLAACSPDDRRTAVMTADQSYVTAVDTVLAAEKANLLTHDQKVAAAAASTVARKVLDPLTVSARAGDPLTDAEVLSAQAALAAFKAYVPATSAQ